MGGYKSGRRKKGETRKFRAGCIFKKFILACSCHDLTKGTREKNGIGIFGQRRIFLCNFFALLDRFGEIGKGKGKALYLHFCISACLSLRYCPYILPLSSILLFQRKIPP